MGGYQGKVYNTPEEAEEFVKTTVDAHSVVLFTKRFSPYCYKATSAFKSIKVQYEEVMLTGRPDCQIIQDVLLSMTGARTVPRVFVHQKCIGGGNETSQLNKEGKLKALVEGKDEEQPTAKDESAPKQEEQQADGEATKDEPAEQKTAETTSDDKPAEDAAAEQTPTEEAPAEQAPADEAPAEKKEEDKEQDAA
ncbi:glutaredoxin-2, mitochondrial-like [Clavelina lepadiformis]|uniref:glutaredoxin-2, mitochondrial-like n=1 Tax=Clavelina lepadiformis TaxID=159417 RepID=UPI0040434F61